MVSAVSQPNGSQAFSEGLCSWHGHIVQTVRDLPKGFSSPWDFVKKIAILVSALFAYPLIALNAVISLAITTEAAPAAPSKIVQEVKEELLRHASSLVAPCEVFYKAAAGAKKLEITDLEKGINEYKDFIHSLELKEEGAFTLVILHTQGPIQAYKWEYSLSKKHPVNYPAASTFMYKSLPQARLYLEGFIASSSPLKNFVLNACTKWLGTDTAQQAISPCDLLVTLHVQDRVIQKNMALDNPNSSPETLFLNLLEDLPAMELGDEYTLRCEILLVDKTDPHKLHAYDWSESVKKQGTALETSDGGGSLGPFSSYPQLRDLFGAQFDFTGLDRVS